MKRYLITLALVALLAVAGTVFAAPSSVDRITNRIEPLIKTDFIRAVYFVATSTTATSTFLGKLQVGTYAGVPQIVGPDIDTGIHFDGPDIFSVHTGGTTRFLINSSGNVGIGTTSPTGTLVVDSSTNATVIIDPNITYNGIRVGGKRGAGGWTNYYGFTGNTGGGVADLGGYGAFGGAALSRYFIGTYTTRELVSILANGSAGFGTTSPGARIDVVGTNNSSIPLFQLSNVVSQATSTKFIVDSTGLVGIGTTTPYAKLAVVGPVAAQSFHATSTAATSTFQGNIVISPDGENPYGFAAGPLVMEGPLAGPYQTIIVNTLDSAVSLSGLTIGNSKFRNPGFTADYYCGFYMAAPSYNLAGLNGVMPNGGAVFCKDGPITIGSATSTAGPEIRFQATGMDSGNVDAVIEGSTGHFGIGTTSPMARLDVVGPNTSPVFQVSTSASFATTSRLIVTATGLVGIGTTTPVGNGLTVSASSVPQITFADQSLAAGNKNFLMRINSNISTGVFQIGSAVDGGSASAVAININRTGFVGMGTTSPARQLDVWGSASITNSANDSSLQIGGTSNIAFIQGANAANNATKSLILQTSGGNVGISTTSPANKLHVYRGAGGGSLGDATNDVLIIENNVSAGINIITPTNAQGGFYFSDNTRAVGRVIYDHSLDALTFSTNSTQRALFDSVGRFGYGTTTPIGQFNLASTSPTIVLSNTTNASHWNIANNDGVFSLSTTSSALVRTATNAVTILNNGNFGVSSSTPAEEFSVGGIGSATSTAYFGSGTGKGSCIIMADTDGSGVTYVTANNGVLTASTVPCN